MTEKYRTDLGKVAVGMNDKSVDTLFDIITKEYKIQARREGYVLFHDKRISKARQNYLRAFTHGLMWAGYGED